MVIEEKSPDQRRNWKIRKIHINLYKVSKTKKENHS